MKNNKINLTPIKFKEQIIMQPSDCVLLSGKHPFLLNSILSFTVNGVK